MLKRREELECSEPTRCCMPGRALAAVGRVPKTIHLLDYGNDPIDRRAILGQINRGEGRHELARRVCQGNKGELPQPYQRGQ